MSEIPTRVTEEQFARYLVVFTELLLCILSLGNGLDTFRRGKDLGRGREA